MFQNARNHISESLKFQNFPEEQLQTELPRKEFYFIYAYSVQNIHLCFHFSIKLPIVINSMQDLLSTCTLFRGD